MAEEGAAPEWLRTTDWETYQPERLGADELVRLEDAFGAFFAGHTRGELYEGALARRILLAPCNDARDVLAHPQLRARDFFTTLELPERGAALEHPAFFVRSSSHETRVRRRAPRIGEHNFEVYGELGVAAAELDKLAAEGVI
jgi:crotonobetainyl-CoA:carnitine CoA-transferase CaiB-like acyl-CoA transferase